MGNSTSASSGTAAARAAPHKGGYYTLLRENAGPSLGGTRGPAVVGGGAAPVGGFFGGADEDPKHGLKDYAISQAALGKERMIRGLARALQRAGIRVDPDAAPEEIARTLEANLPDPRKGKTFAQDAKAHEKVCRTLADVLNQEFSAGASKENRIIDTSAGPAGVCQQLYEIAHSLSVGLQVEFLEVHASLRRVLTNLEVIGKFLEESQRKIHNLGAKAKFKDFGDEKDFAHEDDVLDRVLKEQRHQMRLLKNFLDIHLASPKTELELALKRQGETYNVVKKLRLVPGTGEFADTLASAVSGLGTVTAVSARVDKALREVGLSVQAYLASADLDALESTLNERLYSGAIDREDFGKYLKAVKTLKDNFAERSRLDLEAGGAAYGGGKAAAIRGGGAARRGGAVPDLDLEERTKAYRSEQKLIVSEFMEKSTKQYDLFLKAVQELGPKLGREVPLSDKLFELRNAMKRLGEAQLGVVNVDLALLGVASQALGRETKNLLTGALRQVLAVLDQLMAMELYRGVGHDFAGMRGAVDGLLRLIDLFTDVMAKKRSPLPPRKDGGADVSGFDQYLDLPLLARSEYDLGRAINAFLYFYYVAKIRENLAYTSKELEAYGEDYADLLGDAVAARIQVLRAEKLKPLSREFVTPKLADSSVVEPMIPQEYLTALSDCRAAKIDTRIEFYRALQAVDLYMKAFTEGIAAHPDDVSDIKRILDGVEVIGPWFTEKTGEALADAFDLMPCGGGNQGDDTSIAASDANVSLPSEKFLGPQPGGFGPPEGHYYSRIASRLPDDAEAYPGLPFLPLSANKEDKTPETGFGSRVAAVQEGVNATLDNFQALKNILNAFVRIGAKFGGAELRRQVFMSPSEIYRALHQYLKKSALSCGTVAKAGNAYPMGGASVPGDDPPLKGFPMPMRTGSGVFFGMADVGDLGADFDGGALAGDFQTEDVYFTYCVKAMGAKILTVLGTFDLFERPKPLYQLTPIRMILGGADSVPPPVYPEAAELYFRLPRLAEFYQNLFSQESTEGALQIALLPELEGIFAGFLRLIFLRSGKAAGPGGSNVDLTGADYSEQELYTLLTEINGIFETYRSLSPQNPVEAALMGFVAEVNRHYGVVKKEELQKLYGLYSSASRFERGADMNASLRRLFGELNPTDYAILPDESAGVSRAAAPSDRWALRSGATSLPEKVEDRPLGAGVSLDSHEGAWGQWKLLADFRNLLDATLDLNSQAKYDELRMTSFLPRIAKGATAIRDGKDAAAKFSAAAGLVQGTGQGLTPPGGDIDVNKSYMFHETVMVGLNTLGAIYTQACSVRSRVRALSLKDLRKALTDVLTRPTGLPAGTTPEALRGLVAEAAVANGLKVAAGDIARYFLPSTAIAGQGGGDPTSVFTYQDLWTVEPRDGTPALANKATAFSDAEAKKAAETFFDEPAMMLDLVVLIQGLATSWSSLVGMRFPGTPGSQVVLDFGGLKTAIAQLMEDVRGFIDLFRPYIAPDILARYEEGSKLGSLYWLEANLVDGLVRGAPEPATSPTSAPSARGVDDLDGVARAVNETFVALTSQREVSLYTVVTGATGLLGDQTQPTGDLAWQILASRTWRRTQYGNIFASLAFYAPDASKADLNNTEVEVPAAAPIGEGQQVNGLFAAPPVGPGGAPRRQPGMWQAGGAPPVGRLKLYALSPPDARGLTPGGLGTRSLLFIFNQLLAGYLDAFFDPSTQKIYRGLIEGFALGAFSQAVMYPGGSLPDLWTRAIGGAWGTRGDPTSVLLSSLAYLLNVITTAQATTPPSGSAHLTTALGEVPQYITEAYRANLPTFVKLFDAVTRQGEILKILMGQTNLGAGVKGLARLYNPAMAVAKAAVGLPGDTAAVINNTPFPPANAASEGYPDGAFRAHRDLTVYSQYSSDGTLAAVNSVVDMVMSACYSMGNSGMTVLREIADGEPLYLETQADSIAEYRSRWGKLPMMPLSLAVSALNPRFEISTITGEKSTTKVLWPGARIGQSDFKFLYGTRKLFGRPKAKFTLADAPGVRQQLEVFNGALGGASGTILADRYEDFLQHEVLLLRGAVDFLCVAGAMAPEKPAGQVFRPLMAVATGASPAGENVAIVFDKTAVYPLVLPTSSSAGGTDLDAVMAIPENSYQEQELQKFVAQVDTGGTPPAGRAGAPLPAAGARRSEWIANIIDMNIMPINVHALMRGIPLAPLYNYTYTFEQFVCQMYGLSPETVRLDPGAAATDKPVRNTRQMFVRLLINPYAQVTPEQYGFSTAVYGPEGANGLVTRIFRGDDSLMMGRPKFLSDQVFNKALFGTLYDTPYVYDETGPPGAGRMARGSQRDLTNGVPYDGDLFRPPDGVPSWAAGPGAFSAQAPDATSGISVPNARGEAEAYGLLTYPKNEVGGGLATVDPGSSNSVERLRRLQLAGKARFDTRLVRNLFFISNVQRVLRLRLDQELTEFRNVLIKNDATVNSGVTEYGSLPARTTVRDYPTGPQETVSSRRYNSSRTFFE